MSEEKDYVFTTGWGEEYGDRANTYVIIHGTYMSAREEMFRRYGDKWAFQYEKEEFFEFYKGHPEVVMEREYHDPRYEKEDE